MLVSIILGTFNSEETVIETLASIHGQDYPNLELIIWEDGSTDKTREIIDNWLSFHGKRFTRIEKIYSNVNEGICINFKRAIERSHGEWIKAIAGDDTLMPGAITAFLEKAKETDADAIAAQVTSFELNSAGNIITGTSFPDCVNLEKINRLNCLNYFDIINNNIMASPSAFFSRRIYKTSSGIDMRFKHLEDWPLWINLVLANGKFATIDKPLVYYRTTSGLSMRPMEFRNKDYTRDLVLFYFYYQRKHFSLFRRLDKDIEALRMFLASGLLHKKPMLYAASKFIFLISPLAYKRKLNTGIRRYKALSKK